MSPLPDQLVTCGRRRGHGALAAMLLLCGGAAWGQAVPKSLPVEREAGTASPASSRSKVFDAAMADQLRLRQDPVYVERIFVEGLDPDARRPRRRSLEQSFAETLLAPPPAAAAGLRGLNTTPCFAVQSSLNTIGNSYAPLTGCPGAANTP